MEFKVVREGSGYEVYTVEAPDRETAIDRVDSGFLEPELFELTTVELVYIEGEE